MDSMDMPAGRSEENKDVAVLRRTSSVSPYLPVCCSIALSFFESTIHYLLLHTFESIYFYSSHDDLKEWPLEPKLRSSRALQQALRGAARCDCSNFASARKQSQVRSLWTSYTLQKQRVIS